MDLSWFNTIYHFILWIWWYQAERGLKVTKHYFWVSQQHTIRKRLNNNISQLSKGFMYWNLSLRINSLIQAIAALTLSSAVMLMRNRIASANNWGWLSQLKSGSASFVFKISWLSTRWTIVHIAFYRYLFPNAVFPPLTSQNSGITLYHHVQLKLPNIMNMSCAV